MKWKDFKELIEITVKDEDELWYIVITFDGRITVEKDERYGWKISS
jgi:hypothetical protein